MHPPARYHLMQARTACPDQHQARRGALARAARRARLHRPGHRVPWLQAVAACQVLTMPGARSRRSVS